MKDYSISFTRLVAMLFIVTCHILQYYGSFFAYFFNVGLQLFLIISGYLYSLKQIHNLAEFYATNAKKILYDYYVYIFFIIILLLLDRKITSWQEVINLLLFIDLPLEVAQAWFIPCILFCYAITPALHAILDRICSKNDFWFICASGILLLLIDVMIRNYFTFFTPAWINCYLTGMILRRFDQKKSRPFNLMMPILMYIGFAINIIYFLFNSQVLENISKKLWLEMYNYSHLALAVSIFIVCRMIFDKNLKAKHVLEWSDKYSYDIYLVHNLYILGDYSVLSVFSNPFLAVGIVCALIVSSSVLLNKVTYICKAQLSRLYRN